MILGGHLVDQGKMQPVKPRWAATAYSRHIVYKAGAGEEGEGVSQVEENLFGFTAS